MVKDNFVQHIASEWQEHFSKSDLALLNDLRRAHFDQFMNQGLPDQKNEQWKYTNLAAIKKLQFSIISEESGFNENIEQYFQKDCYRLVFVDGFYKEQYSSVSASNVVITPIATALQEHRDLIGPYLNAIQENCAFSKLNMACLKEGAFIFVSKTCQAEKPIQLLYLSTSNNVAALNNIRNIIVADTGAQLTIIEEHVSLQEQTYFSNVATSLHANESANIEYIKIQNQHRQSFHVGSINVIQKRDSQVNVHHISLGSQLARENLNCYLEDQGSSVNINGLYLPLSQQHIDVHTYINHNAENTVSEQFYKGMAAKKSRAVFNGKINVVANIKKVVANLQNKNLLLTTDSEINTKPELEIYSDDVKCRHGATVGQLDAEMLFYLRSRGIDLDQAYQLLLLAFIEEHLTTVPIPNIAEKIKKLVSNYCEGCRL